jgi:hypothetical protein
VKIAQASFGDFGEVTMSVTITLPEPLAGQLKSEAQQRQVGLTEFAADLLARALEGTRDTTGYEVNQQRLALLHKSAKTGLTPREAHELQELQGKGFAQLAGNAWHPGRGSCHRQHPAPQFRLHSASVDPPRRDRP